MDGHQSSARRVSEVPELLSFICRFSPQSTQAQTLQASHSFFNVAAPILWENIRAVHHILRLLPGMVVAGDTRGSGASWTITFPKHSGLVNSDRFNLYAKFIRYLEIYPDSEPLGPRGYAIKGWPRPLFTSGSALLPNLLQLTLTAPSIKSHEQFLWIRTFLSPSLRIIRVQSSPDSFPPDISPLVANALLGHIKSNCPRLHTLSLFPVRPLTSDDYSMVEYWEPPGTYYTHLATLQLRELGCATDIFDPDIAHILTQFSALERLEVYNTEYKTGSTTRIALPSSELALPPAVRHFALYLSSQQLAFKTLALGIFSRLSSLTLSFEEPMDDTGDDDADDDRSDEHWGTELMTLISRACPDLTSLSLEFDEGSPFNLSSISIIRPLSALPLRSICFRNLVPLCDPVLEDMHNIFPLVAKIEIPDLVFELDELYYFSRFPNLEHLVIGLAAMSLPSASDPAPTIAPKFQVLESTNSIEVSVNLSPLARYLLSFWPNLEKVLWVEYECSNPLHGDHSHKDSVLAGALNTLIEIYRTNPDPVRSTRV